MTVSWVDSAHWQIVPDGLVDSADWARLTGAPLSGLSGLFNFTRSVLTNLPEWKVEGTVSILQSIYFRVRSITIKTKGSAPLCARALSLLIIADSTSMSSPGHSVRSVPAFCPRGAKEDAQLQWASTRIEANICRALGLWLAAREKAAICIRSSTCQRSTCYIEFNGFIGRAEERK